MSAILRAGDYLRMPWKNGGGETAEIAVFPPGAGMEDFGWRLSMATVAADGPFSIFPGIDRTLTIVSGAGMKLAMDGGPAVTLTAASAPLAFSADRPVTAALLDGPIADLNVMTRRGAFRHRVERLEGACVVTDAGALFALGGLRVTVMGQSHDLDRFDTLLLPAAAGPVETVGAALFVALVAA